MSASETPSLVDRLRSIKNFWLNGSTWVMGTEPSPWAIEGANRIEQLESELTDRRHTILTAGTQRHTRRWPTQSAKCSHVLSVTPRARKEVRNEDFRFRRISILPTYRIYHVCPSSVDYYMGRDGMGNAWHIHTD